MLTALLGIAGVLVVLGVGSFLAREEPADTADEPVPR